MEESSTDESRQVGGYSAKAIAKSLVEAPSISATEPKEHTNNKEVKFLVAGGALIVLVGLIVFIVASPIAGFFIAALGGGLAIFAVFAPVGVDNKDS